MKHPWLGAFALACGLVLPVLVSAGTPFDDYVDGLAASSSLSATDSVAIVQGASGSRSAFKWFPYNYFLSRDGSNANTAAITRKNLGAMPVIDVRDYGAKFDGIADDTTAINSAITAGYAMGAAYIPLPPGTTVVTSIVPKSHVRVEGAAMGGTTITCAASPCISQTPGSQLAGWSLSHVGFVAGAGQSAATAISLTSVQYSEFGWLRFSGFTGGTLLNIAGQPVTTFDDSTVGQNIIFNSFHDWYSPGSANGMVIKGHYSASPPNIDMVVTQNEFRNITTWVDNKCVDVIAGADTNAWYNQFCRFAANGAVGIVQGDDPLYSTVNTFVNSNKFFMPVFSASAGITTFTFFGGNFSFGTEAYGIEHDTNTASPTVTVNAMTLSASHRLMGKRLDASANVLLGKLEKGIAWDFELTQPATEGFLIPAANLYQYSAILLSGSGTLNAGEVQLPCGAPDGQNMNISTTAVTVNAFTLSSCPTNPGPVLGGPTRIDPGSPIQFRYIASSNSWYRVGGSLASNSPFTFPVPDNAISISAKGATNQMRLIPQVGGVTIDSNNAAGNAYQPFAITGSTLALKSGAAGTNAVEVDAAQATTFRGAVKAPALTTSLGSLAGSICAQADGTILYKVGANCF
jgi:hypothetical protein